MTYGSYLSMWLINIAILLFCLIRILFYGEPYIIEGSKSSTNLEKTKKSAETLFQDSKDPTTTFERFSSCLSCFDVKLPKTKFDRYISITWQFIRMFMYGTFGKLVAKRTNSSKSKSDVLYSARELAFIYHRLNQISLTSKIDEKNGLLMSLCSINMTEVAANVMEPHDVAEIYLTAALRAKRSFFKFVSRYQIFFRNFFFNITHTQILNRYYLLKAKQYLSLPNCHSEHKWIVTTHGYRFILTHDFDYCATESEDTHLFYIPTHNSNPLTHVVKVKKNLNRNTFL